MTRQLKKRGYVELMTSKRQMPYYQPTSKHTMSASRQPEIVDRQEKPKEEL